MRIGRDRTRGPGGRRGSPSWHAVRSTCRGQRPLLRLRRRPLRLGRLRVPPVPRVQEFLHLPRPLRRRVPRLIEVDVRVVQLGGLRPPPLYELPPAGAHGRLLAEPPVQRLVRAGRLPAGEVRQEVDPVEAVRRGLPPRRLPAPCGTRRAESPARLPPCTRPGGGRTRLHHKAHRFRSLPLGPRAIALAWQRLPALPFALLTPPLRSARRRPHPPPILPRRASGLV